MRVECGQCTHFDNDPVTLEKAFRGINILSSVHGSTRGDTGICCLHDLFLLPSDRCSDFQQGSGAEGEGLSEGSG